MHYGNGVFRMGNKEIVENYWTAHFERDWGKDGNVFF